VTITTATKSSQE